MTVLDPLAPQGAPLTAARPYDRLAVIGAGAWGTALAITAARSGRQVALWTRRPEHAQAMRDSRRNLDYLPEGAVLPESLHPTADMAEALRGAEAVLLVVPSAAVAETAALMAPHLAAGVPVALGAKGIEPGTGLLMTDVAARALPGRPMACVSGPNFADQTALGHPTAATVASDCGARFRTAPERTVAVRLAVSLGTPSFRPYVSDDLTGVEIGGAIKNVIAVACGIASGAGFGENTRAALATRGLAEMKRLSEARGGRRETVTGRAGVGDLMLTCFSDHSRNLRLGLQLGAGVPRADCFDGKPVVVEGEGAAISVTDLARLKGVHLPICEAVRAILHEGLPIPDAFGRLWGGPLEGEPKALDLLLGHPSAQGAVGTHYRKVLA